MRPQKWSSSQYLKCGKRYWLGEFDRLVSPNVCPRRQERRLSAVIGVSQLGSIRACHPGCRQLDLSLYHSDGFLPAQSRFVFAREEMAMPLNTYFPGKHPEGISGLTQYQKAAIGTTQEKRS